MNGKIELLFTLLICVTFLLLIPITIYLPIDNHSSNDNGKSIENNFTDKSEISNILKNKVKIFCIILTSPKNHQKRAIHQINTWVRRCNNYIFGSGDEDTSLKAIKSCNNDSYYVSMCKFKNTIKYVWNRYGDEYDWYIKVDDDTYVIMENLRGYLINRNPNELSYHGFRLEYDIDNRTINYLSGGAGYVMSKESVKLLVEKGLDSPEYCRQADEAYDDVEVGNCFKNLGVNLTGSVDVKGKPLFNANRPHEIIVFFSKYSAKCASNVSYSDFKCGFERLPEFPITFHYVDGSMMYAMEYFFYHANVLGKTMKFGEINGRHSENGDKDTGKKIRLMKLFSQNYFP
uniref:N-acetylgalactosaminide beta-1,3-galactosyltransferase n=1 Tax=Strongyloides papillosus TaxID=174720 RepID=A0A0N5CAZ8_STREA